MGMWGDFVYWHAGSAVISLVLLLFAAVILQNRRLARRKEILVTLPAKIQGTTLFTSAMAYLERRIATDGQLFASGAQPTAFWFLVFIVFSGAMATFFGAALFVDTATPSYILGGPKVFSDQSAQSGSLVTYQSSTLFTGAMAFIGAYIWAMTTLLTRLNNDDVTPSTYYFLAFRILEACLIAGVARHLLGSFDEMPAFANDTKALAGLGFVIGLNPALWIDYLFQQVASRLHLGYARRPSAEDNNLPKDLSLLLIQGLGYDRIERLKELDIDNVQKLAAENPVLIWLKTPYSMELIVDWIAQANLLLLFDDGIAKKLRDAAIRDVFRFVIAAKDPGSAPAMQGITGLDANTLASVIRSIEDDPIYKRLFELRTSLCP